MHEGKSAGEMPPYFYSRVRVTFAIDHNGVHPQLPAGPDKENLTNNVLETGVVEGDAYTLEFGTFFYASDSVAAEEGTSGKALEALQIGKKPFGSLHDHLGGGIVDPASIPQELITKIEVVVAPEKTRKGW